MTPLKAIAGVLTGTAMVFGGVDASSLNEQHHNGVMKIAGNDVVLEQIGNSVETTFRWKDQKGIKVKVDLGEPTAAEKLKDKRKKEVITETVTDFEGGFKVDLLLNEKPDTNRFCYKIEGHENYDFFYQPPLTEQEKAEGASRPPEIEGSYAVYHKTLKNHVIGQENYATGKVMHIPRPQVWSMSDVDTKVWADMSYDAGQLCVTVPQDFLNGAKYPVRVDPTFGYTTIGASNGGWGSGYWRALGATSTYNGTLTHVVIYTDDTGSLGDIKGLVTDSSLIITGTGQGFSNITTGPKWWFSTTTVSLQQGSYVWAGAVVTGASVLVYYDSLTGSSTARIDSTNSFISPTNPTDATTGFIFSLYAVYTASTTPNVTTSAATNIDKYTAVLNGNITYTGTTSITNHGFAWGSSQDLSGGDTATTSLGSGDAGAYSEQVTVQVLGNVYYFRAFATNDAGTTTGEIYSFLVPFIPKARINNGTLRINNGGLDL